MRFCAHCGKEIRDEAVVCPNCGCPAEGAKGSELDVPSTGLNILAFFFPLVGLILFLVFRDKTPGKASAIGKWALIGFCVGIGFSVLLYGCSAAMLLAL